MKTRRISMCGWDVSLSSSLIHGRVFYDFIEHYVFQKRMYSSKIGMPIWYIMLAFMQENM